jgi:aspartyl/asparaginyl beta-hydroxylase (cupin superfamily)
MIEQPMYFLRETDSYTGAAPLFYNPKDFDWAKTLEDNWGIISQEMANLITGNEQMSLSSPNPPYLSKPGVWKNIYFWNFMWQYHANCKLYPRTYNLLRSIPNLTFAEFTVLEPNSAILPHIGETNTTIRGHLAIEVPAPLPICGIKVGNEQRGYEQGKVLLFSDCHLHTVWNHSSSRRFVLVFDITKQEYAKNIYWVNAQCLGALSVKYLTAKMAVLNQLPDSLLRQFHLFFSVLWRAYLPLQRSVARWYEKN